MSYRFSSLSRVYAQIIFFTMLAMCAVNHSLAQRRSSPDLRSQVEAFLNNHDDLSSPSQRQGLGNEATPILESIATDHTALPSRRARALAGLSALGSGESTMRLIANADGEPLNVRISAVHGLAQILPESDLIPVLRPLLKDAKSQMRGITAEALSNTPAGCAEIAGIALRESPAWRARYTRPCQNQADSADQPPLDRDTPVVDYFGIATTAQLFNPSGNQVVPPNIGCGGVCYIGQYGGFSTVLPTTPEFPFESGKWAFDFGASYPGDTVDVHALIKTAPTPTLTSGKLNVNFFFVGVPGLDANSAPTDPNFQTILSKVKEIYAQVGVQLGDITYIDITGEDQVSFEILDYTDDTKLDFQRLFMLSANPRAHADAVSIFLVYSVGSGVPGFDPGVPGNPVLGTPGSGAVVAAADFSDPGGPLDIAITTAHEIGHWLGLYHVQDPANLMYSFLSIGTYPVDANGTPLPLLTPDQQFTILHDPVVGPSPGSAERVYSVPLGSFTIPESGPVGPVPVDVPPGAVSFDLVGVDRFTPTTIRVPEDFPTIQLAVNGARPLDTIRVGPGRWCGASITEPLHLVGDGATIIGCPPGVPGPVGITYRQGFQIQESATGTSICQFVFDGKGVSDSNHQPLSYGIDAVAGADDLTIEFNTFLGTLVAIDLGDGKNYQVDHNVFDGFTIGTTTGQGGVAIFESEETAPLPPAIFKDRRTVIQFNQFTSTVPAGDLSGFSWDSVADVPLAGIIVSGMEGVTISNNRFSITANSNGEGGIGILATDAYSGLPTPNLTVTNNDGRGSAYALIVDLDQNGGTGNTVGAVIWRNLGVNLIDGVTETITRNSKQRPLICDPVTGVCPFGD
jgi:hypothetical protein